MKWRTALFGAAGCCICWYLLDRFLFDDVGNMHYYIGIFFAYVAGAGPSFSSEDREGA